MKPWLLGIGVGKSGSHSLATALERLGVRTCHVGHATHHGDRSVQDAITANAAAGRPILDGIDGYEALVDWPVNEHWYAISTQYPEARFILTYRSPHECALSWCRMVYEQQTSPEGAPGGYSEYVHYVEDHVDAVFKVFAAQPGRLLALDMKDSDAKKWAVLSRFLGRPAPEGMPYPMEFAHE